MKAAIFKNLLHKTTEISRFFGENYGSLKNGQLLESNNVCVLSGGAVSSMLASRKIDLPASEDIEGVYTFYDKHDEYEIRTSADWVYENICPESVMQYEKWQLAASRVLVKDIGKGAKTSDGYRKVVGAFADDQNTYVFYEGMYNIIDERRLDEFSKLGNGYICKFFSGKDGEYVGCVNVYTLVQIFLDVIDSFGGITTTLVSAKLILRDEITNSKYQKSTLISTDSEVYKYVTPDYIPSIGASYTVSYDRVYTELYPTLDGYGEIDYVHLGEKRAVRYCNKVIGDTEFAGSGDKLMLLPDMRLIESNGEKYALSSDVCDTMPTLYAAVQYFDRLFGINENTLYVSKSGECTTFNEEDGGWRMITADNDGFSAITVFDGRVFVFTKERMISIKGTALPFEFVDHAGVGCVSQDAIAVFGGALYFVSPFGVMKYNGSTLKNISDILPKGIDYSVAKLASLNGSIVLYLGDSGNVWIYEPQSDSWSRRNTDAEAMHLVGEHILQYESGVYSLYKAFDSYGKSSFKIALENDGRRRVKNIMVTAKVGVDASVTLKTLHGDMKIYGCNGITTRCFFPRGLYFDNGEICFEGEGEYVLYGVRIEYYPLLLSAKKIK